MSYNTWSQ